MKIFIIEMPTDAVNGPSATQCTLMSYSYTIFFFFNEDRIIHTPNSLILWLLLQYAAS